MFPWRETTDNNAKIFSRLKIKHHLNKHLDFFFLSTFYSNNNYLESVYFCGNKQILLINNVYIFLWLCVLNIFERERSPAFQYIGINACVFKWFCLGKRETVINGYVCMKRQVLKASYLLRGELWKRKSEGTGVGGADIFKVCPDEGRAKNGFLKNVWNSF